jgi:hypothetical protein
LRVFFRLSASFWSGVIAWQLRRAVLSRLTPSGVGGCGGEEGSGGTSVRRQLGTAAMVIAAAALTCATIPTAMGRIVYNSRNCFISTGRDDDDAPSGTTNFALRVGLVWGPVWGVLAYEVWVYVTVFREVRRVMRGGEGCEGMLSAIRQLGFYPGGWGVGAGVALMGGVDRQTQGVDLAGASVACPSHNYLPSFRRQHT